MINKHLTDEQVQDYILDEKTLPAAAEHIAGCEACQAKVSDYRALFSSLAGQEPASFGFDIGALVLERMAEPVKRPAWVTAVFVMLSVLGIAVPVVFFILYRENITALFTGLAPMILPLTGTAIVTLLVFLVGDMYKQYRKKLEILEMN